MITYITPHKDCLRRIKSYRRCPEIRHKIDELSWTFWHQAAIAVPTFVILGLPIGIILLGKLFEDLIGRINLPRPIRPRATYDIMWELHEILPAYEIRKRIEA